MRNLLLKKIKGNKSIVASSIFLLFSMFATLNILFLFCWNFFSSIYLYSSGYSNTCYYSKNNVTYSEILKNYQPDDIAYSFDVENQLVDEETLLSTAYCNENTLYKGFGLCLTNRVFVKAKNISKQENSNFYCLISDNLKTQEKELTKNNISYPIVGTFKIDMTSVIKRSFKQSGINNIQLALFVDKRITPSSVNLIVDNSKNQYYISSASFYSGKELNDQVRDGYSLFQPLIYIGYLIPMIAAAIAFLLILSSIQNKSIEELKTLRILSFRKKDIFHLLFYERLFECLIGALISYILFIPFFIIVTKEFYAVSFIVLFLQIVYAVLLLFFYSKKEVKKIYKKGGTL